MGIDIDIGILKLASGIDRRVAPISEIGDRQKAPTDPIQACPLGDVGRKPE